MRKHFDGRLFTGCDVCKRRQEPWACLPLGDVFTSVTHCLGGYVQDGRYADGAGARVGDQLGNEHLPKIRHTVPESWSFWARIKALESYSPVRNLLEYPKSHFGLCKNEDRFHHTIGSIILSVPSSEASQLSSRTRLPQIKKLITFLIYINLKKIF